MKRLYALLGICAVAAAPLSAQSVSSNIGTVSSVSGVDHQITSQQMTGMKITAKLENNLSASGFWGDLGGGAFGVDLWSDDTHLARIEMTPGTQDTYFGQWLVTLYQRSNLTNLIFEGGAQYGGVLFDRCGFAGSDCPVLAGIPLPPGDVGTAGSDIGQDFLMNPSPLVQAPWMGINAVYSNAVGLGLNAPVGDLFTTVSVDFTEAALLYDCFFIFCSTDSDVPDKGPKGNPFAFYMDTDLGAFSTVPEPSTYALMAAGLAALGYAGRRRRKA